MSDRMKDHLVIAALQQVFTYRQPDAGLIHHSDRGSQYTSKDFRDFFNQALSNCKYEWSW